MRKYYLCFMRRKEYFDQTCKQLSELYPPEEARAIAFVLFEKYLQLRREDIFLAPSAETGRAPELPEHSHNS